MRRRPTDELTLQDIAELEVAFDGPYAARDRLWFVLGYTTGVRVQEVIEILVGDVWIDGRVADRCLVHRGYQRQSRPPALDVIWFPERVRDAIAAWVQQLQATEGHLDPRWPLFLSYQHGAKKYEPITRQWVHKWLQRTGRRAIGRGVAPRALRRTYLYHYAQRASLMQVHTAARVGTVDHVVRFLGLRADLPPQEAD